VNDADAAKRDAAEAAARLLPEAGVIGLGTGTTARFFIERVGAFVAAGRRLVGVPTSLASRELAERAGIPLLPDEGPWPIDVCVDGADEVDESLCVIKGGGGALLREKIVNGAAVRNIIVVDRSKLSPKLGTRWPVPVEVTPFGHRAIAHKLAAFGRPELRLRGGDAFVTDGGHLIYDLHCGVIADPAALERELDTIAGVVETGLFVGRATTLLIADADGVEQRDAPPAAR
jgi:ribose 5-phosphate isomerase A